jgi:hypothetical protein
MRSYLPPEANLLFGGEIPPDHFVILEQRNRLPRISGSRDLGVNAIQFESSQRFGARFTFEKQCRLHQQLRCIERIDTPAPPRVDDTLYPCLLLPVVEDNSHRLEAQPHTLYRDFASHLSMANAASAGHAH